MVVTRNLRLSCQNLRLTCHFISIKNAFTYNSNSPLPSHPKQNLNKAREKKIFGSRGERREGAGGGGGGRACSGRGFGKLCVLLEKFCQRP